MEQARLSLCSLPPEILLQIHFLAQNPSLALVSTACHGYLSAPYVTPAYTADYLLNLYSTSAPNAILVKALRHPICTVEVASSIQRIWDRRRGYIPPQPVEGDENEDKGKRKEDPERSERSPSPQRTPSPPPAPSRPALSVHELPRRLFRNLDGKSPVPPLLSYLFDTYTPSANSHNGYPLSRAVLSKNKEVITYLLAHGAEPGLREGLAVEIAAKLGDISIVQMLVDNSDGKEVDITPKFVELAVRSGSDQIVQYFVHDKGVMPPLHSIMQLGNKPKKARVVSVDNASIKGAKRKRSLGKPKPATATKRTNHRA